MEEAQFLDYLKPIMQRGKSYIKDSGDFIIVVDPYPSISHEAA